MVIYWSRFREEVVFNGREWSTKEFGIISRKRCCWNSLKVAVQFSVQQLHRPGVSSQAKDTENCRYIVLQIKKQLRFFRIIVFANQLSLHGAVAEICEECESLHDRSWRPDTVMGQSIVLSVIKTEVPFDCDDPENQDLLLRQYGERIEKLSQQDKLSKKFYGCRISKCCLNWTVFHYKRHWRTIVCKILSWIHSSKKWWIITTERMDSGKHENWTRTGSYDLLPVW